MLITGFLEEAVQDGRYVFQVVSQIGQLGNELAEEAFLRESRPYYKPYLEREEVMDLFRRELLCRGLFFVRGSKPAIRQETSSELIRFKPNSHNRGLHN